MVQVHPGIEGIVRIVTLRTSTQAELQLPVAKLFQLLIAEQMKEVITHFYHGNDISPPRQHYDFII